LGEVDHLRELARRWRDPGAEERSLKTIKMREPLRRNVSCRTRSEWQNQNNKSEESTRVCVIDRKSSLIRIAIDLSHCTIAKISINNLLS
jgi:hypothetical protein